MYKCWAWIDNEWVEGFDCGTSNDDVVFRPLDSIAEKDYSAGYYCEQRHISYGVVKPRHKGSDADIINQTLRSV